MKRILPQFLILAYYFPVSFTVPQYYALLIFSFLVYWLIPTQLIRRRFLVVVSFFFYALWNYRFFSLLLISASTDYLMAKLIAKREEPRLRKLFLAITIAVNFGLLGYFKYFNLLVDSVNFAAHGVGLGGFNVATKLILPLGISFYTFHTVSYTIDVYNKKVDPITNFWDYFLFVCYFPQLVAGPIARVNLLYPQFFQKKELEFQRTVDAILMICFGVMMKLLIADTLGAVTDFLYAKSELSAALGWAAVFSFGYQIYVDFWSYTLIARGSSRLFGIELNPNFEQPYLATSPSEFWRRWHMSLSSWFRDYVYIPLGGNRVHAVRNLLFTMTLAGLWHGSSILFVLWGFYHGVLLVISRKFPLPKPVSFVATFLCVNLGWILFRSQSLEQAGKMFRSLVQFTAPDPTLRTPIFLTVVAIGITVSADLWFQFHSRKFFVALPGHFNYAKLSVASALLMLAVYLGESSATPFIYFNF